MAKAYWVATYRFISDPEALAGYAKLAGPAITAAGGRFLARGTAAKAYEAGLVQRVVIIELRVSRPPPPPMTAKPIRRRSRSSARAPIAICGSSRVCSSNNQEFVVAPAKAGVQGQACSARPGFPLFAGMTK